MSFPGKSIRSRFKLAPEGILSGTTLCLAGERWRLIESPAWRRKTVCLDIGCNIGNFTANAANKGMFAIGVGMFEQFVQLLGQVHQTGAAFGCRILL